MTKAELEKEAEEKYCKVDREFIACQDEGEVFNIGYVLGAEPREKRIEELIALINAERKRQEECDDVHLRKIAELEKENEQLRNSGFTVSAMTEQQLKIALEKGEQLEKENAELKADNDARKFAMAMSEKVEKQLREEIAELKAEIENDRDLPAIAYMQGAEKQKKKDEEELKKWKGEWQEQVQKATDEGYARTLQTMQLSKAKEIIKTFLAIVNNDVEYVQNPQDCKDLWKELCEKAEQFLSEVEK